MVRILEIDAALAFKKTAEREKGDPGNVKRQRVTSLRLMLQSTTLQHFSGSLLIPPL